jgi:hypothetical protein
LEGVSGFDLHIYQATKKSLPEDDNAHNIEMRNEIKHGMQSQQDEVCNLQERREIEMVNSEKWCGGPRNKDTDLVDKCVS